MGEDEQRILELELELAFWKKQAMKKNRRSGNIVTREDYVDYSSGYRAGLEAAAKTVEKCGSPDTVGGKSIAELIRRMLYD